MTSTGSDPIRPNGLGARCAYLACFRANRNPVRPAPAADLM